MNFQTEAMEEIHKTCLKDFNGETEASKLQNISKVSENFPATIELFIKQ